MKNSKEVNPPDFIQIPYQLLICQDIQPSDQIIYGLIYWFFNGEKGICYASNVLLARLANISESTVENGLNRLEKNGFIERVFQQSTKKKVRKEIIPLVTFQKLQPLKNGDYQTSTPSNVGAAAPSNVGQMQTSNTENITANAVVGEEPKKTEEPFSLPEYAKVCLTDPKKFVQIIGLYWQYKNPINIETKGQASKEIGRWSTAAKDLSEWDLELIEKRIKWVKNKAESEGWKWNLATVGKYITEDLSQIN